RLRKPAQGRGVQAPPDLTDDRPSARACSLAPPDPRERLPLADLERAHRVHEQDRLLPCDPLGFSPLDVAPCRLGQPEAARPMRKTAPVLTGIGAPALDDDQRDSGGDRELPPHLLRGFDAVDRVDDRPLPIQELAVRERAANVVSGEPAREAALDPRREQRRLDRIDREDRYLQGLTDRLRERALAGPRDAREDDEPAAPETHSISMPSRDSTARRCLSISSAVLS